MHQKVFRSVEGAISLVLATIYQYQRAQHLVVTPLQKSYYCCVSQNLYILFGGYLPVKKGISLHFTYIMYIHLVLVLYELFLPEFWAFSFLKRHFFFLSKSVPRDFFLTILDHMPTTSIVLLFTATSTPPQEILKQLIQNQTKSRNCTKAVQLAPNVQNLYI